MTSRLRFVEASYSVKTRWGRRARTPSARVVQPSVLVLAQPQWEFEEPAHFTWRKVVKPATDGIVGTVVAPLWATTWSRAPPATGTAAKPASSLAP